MNISTKFYQNPHSFQFWSMWPWPWSQKLKCLDNLDNLENALTATVFEIEVSYAHQLCLGHHQTSPPNLRKIRKYFWLWSFSLQLSYTKKISDLKVQFSKSLQMSRQFMSKCEKLKWSTFLSEISQIILSPRCDPLSCLKFQKLF